MKILIVEDDFPSRLIMQKMLGKYGRCHTVVNGVEAVDAFRNAVESNDPYDLVCLDIMMPELDGQSALKQMRQLEESRGIFSTCGTKIIMTTALGRMENVMEAFRELCDGYLVKPIEPEKLYQELEKLELI